MVTVEEILEHHGVKGMKWGVRKASRGSSDPTDVVLRTKGKSKIKISGGKGHGPSEDAVNKVVVRQKAKASGINSLSNKELQLAIQRMNLERQFNSLSSSNAAKKFLAKLLKDTGQRKGSEVFNEQVDKALNKK